MWIGYEGSMYPNLNTWAVCPMQKRDCSVKFAGMGCNWSMYQSLNNWAVFWMNQVQLIPCCKKVAQGRKVAGAIKFWVNARGL